MTRFASMLLLAAAVLGAARPGYALSGREVIVQVSDIARGSDAYNVLSVYGPNLQIKATGSNTLRFQDLASNDIGNVVTYTAATRWGRIRPIGTNMITGEYSTDRVQWMTLGMINVTVPVTVGVELTSGTNNTNVSGAAKFESLESCP